MTFWLMTPNNIYKNWLNSHIDRIMFTVSKLEIQKGKIVLEHPVFELAADKNIYQFVGTGRCVGLHPLLCLY